MSSDQKIQSGQVRSIQVSNPHDASALADWQKFYNEVFGLKEDFSSLTVPAHRNGFDRLIVVAEGLSVEGAYQKCNKLYIGCKKYTDRSLDETIPTNDRVPTATYAVWIRDRVEADQELKNRSANQLKQAGVNCITLSEHLLHELNHFWATGKHLNIENRTLCAGSRSSEGNVPLVCWWGWLSICWAHPDFADPGNPHPRYAHSEVLAREVVI